MTRPSNLGDDGVTLIELIVGIVVSGLFAGMLVVAFVNGWTLQQGSFARDTATGQATVLKTTMSDSLRNATAIRVSSSGTRVDAVVAKQAAPYSGTWQWECRAWVLTSQSVRYNTSTGPLGADASTWAVLVGKSAQRPLDSVAVPSGATPFTLVGSKGVQVALNLKVGDDPKAVTLSDGMTAQAVATTGAPACW